MTVTADRPYYTPPLYTTGDPVTAPSAPTVAADPSTDDTSSLAFITSYISQIFGGALTQFAENAWHAYNSGVPIEQILADLRATPEYAARFPGMAALRQAGRPVTESTYLDLERSYVQIARQFDLPPGFYDSPDDFGRLIGSEVSPAEYQRRLTDWQTYERDTRDPVAAEEINRQLAAEGHTVSDGDFLAAVIDPSRAIAAIERRLSAGQIGTEAVRAGYGQLAVDVGLRLADQGVTQQQARQGFDVLAGSTELFGQLPGEAGSETFGQPEQLGAVFGTDAAARRRVETQRQRRTAAFGGGGGTTLGRSGIVGLGPSGQ